MIFPFLPPSVIHLYIISFVPFLFFNFLPPSLPPATAGLQLRRLYRSQLILGSIDTGLLLGLALWFAWSARSARLEHRVWNRRQTYFSKTAGALLCLQLLHSAVYVAALGAALDQEGCAFPWAAVAALEFVRVRHALLGCAALRWTRPATTGWWTTGRLLVTTAAQTAARPAPALPLPCPCPCREPCLPSSSSSSWFASKT